MQILKSKIISILDPRIKQPRVRQSCHKKKNPYIPNLSLYLSLQKKFEEPARKLKVKANSLSTYCFKETAEEKVRLRRASQIQVDAVQRAEAAYRRQRMALEKEATSYRRASIEIQRARIMKEMYCSGNDKNGDQESVYNFGSLKGLFKGRKMICDERVCGR